MAQASTPSGTLYVVTFHDFTGSAAEAVDAVGPGWSFATKGEAETFADALEQHVATAAPGSDGLAVVTEVVSGPSASQDLSAILQGSPLMARYEYK